MRNFMILALMLAAFTTGCSTRASSNMDGSAAQTTTASTGTAALPPLPPGAEGALIQQGRDIIENTPKYAHAFSRANMSCEACHNAAGTKAHAGSFVGIYGEFPQWNKRSKRFIALQDRLAECFLYSMNGRPPAYSSRDMIALTAYIAYVSRGTKIGDKATDQKLIAFSPDHTPSVKVGAKIYAQKCMSCHGANGAGVGTQFPPLWGPTSFNSGAGMHRLNTMSAFVRYNMPYGAAPNSLSKQEAYDVSAYVLSHTRPSFDRNQVILFPPKKASFY